MQTRTTVRSWPAIGLGAFFAGVTGRVLFDDVIGGAPVNTGHVLALAALVAAIASGHMAWPTFCRGQIVPAALLAVLFLSSTAYVVISSGARNAETAGTKAATAEDTNRQRAAIEKMAREAQIILGTCTAETPRQYHGVRCGLRDAMVAECATGKGKACDGKSYSVTTYEAALEGYQKRLAKLGPTAKPNGGYAHAARVLAALTASPDVDGIEQRLVLVLPFLVVVIAELGTITFVHLGIGHSQPARLLVGNRSASQRDVAQTSFAGLAPAELFAGDHPDNRPGRGGPRLPVRPDIPRPLEPGKKPDISADDRRQQVLQALLTDLALGRTFGAQRELCDRYGVERSTMSDWLREWEAAGLIPARRTVGRRKEIAG